MERQNIVRFDYPLLFNSIPVPRPWGAGRACNYFSRKSSPPGQLIGEWYDISTWPSDPAYPEIKTVTSIANGHLAGIPLDKVTPMPIVAKLIDSAQALSVQVHPVSAQEGQMSKDEMWYILHADPNAHLFCGLADGVSPKALCDLIRSDKPPAEAVMGMLNRADAVAPGMHFNVPSGTAHAFGPGLIAIEISERTQVTYRLFDYNSSRQLHIDEGCKAMITPRPDASIPDPGIEFKGASAIETLSAFPKFSIYRAHGASISVQSANHMHFIAATRSDCRLEGPSSQWSVTIKHSNIALIPPVYEPYTIYTEDGGEALIGAIARL